MLGNSAGGLQQVDAEPHRAIAVVREVDRALGDGAQAPASAGDQLAVEDAVLERRVAANVRRPGSVSRWSLPVRNCAGAHLPCEPIAAAVDAEREPRGRAAGQVERGASRASASSCPCRRCSRLIARRVPDQRRDEPVRPARSTRAPRSNLLRSGSASSLKARRSPPLFDHRGKLDQRPAATDVGLAAHAAAARLVRRPVARSRAGRCGVRRCGCRSREGSVPSSCWA